MKLNLDTMNKTQNMNVTRRGKTYTSQKQREYKNQEQDEAKERGISGIIVQVKTRTHTIQIRVPFIQTLHSITRTPSGRFAQGVLMSAAQFVLNSRQLCQLRHMSGNAAREIKFKAALRCAKPEALISTRYGRPGIVTNYMYN